jgi:hypothetical protein
MGCCEFHHAKAACGRCLRRGHRPIYFSLFFAISRLRGCLRRVTFFCLDAKESNQRKDQVSYTANAHMANALVYETGFTEPLRG